MHIHKQCRASAYAHRRDTEHMPFLAAIPFLPSLLTWAQTHNLPVISSHDQIQSILHPISPPFSATHLHQGRKRKGEERKSKSSTDDTHNRHGDMHSLHFLQSCMSPFSILSTSLLWPCLLSSSWPRAPDWPVKRPSADPIALAPPLPPRTATRCGVGSDLSYYFFSLLCIFLSRGVFGLDCGYL